MSCSASLEMVSYIYLKMSRGLKFQMLLPEVITLLSVIYGVIELQRIAKSIVKRKIASYEYPTSDTVDAAAK